MEVFALIQVAEGTQPIVHAFFEQELFDRDVLLAVRKSGRVELFNKLLAVHFFDERLFDRGRRGPAGIKIPSVDKVV